MFRNEVISPEGLRCDGRRSKELRRVICKTSVFPSADGSAYYQQGNTKVLVTVYGPRECSRKSSQSNEKASINLTLNTTSFSTTLRKQALKRDRRVLDTANTIKQIFESVIDLDAFPRSEIDICVQVLQIDGGTLHCAINACTLGLIDAGIPMSDFVTSCSAGLSNDQVILDLNFIEESTDVPVLSVAVMPRSGRVLMVGLEERIHIDFLEGVMGVAKDGAVQVCGVLEECIRKRTIELAKALL